MSNNNNSNNNAHPNIQNAGQLSSPIFMGHSQTLPPTQNTPVGTTITTTNGSAHINTGTSWATLSPQYNMQSASIYGNTTLHGSNGANIGVDEVVDFIETMKRRMCMIDANLEKHELYPALKEAYENYLIIERLCCGDDKDAK